MDQFNVAGINCGIGNLLGFKQAGFNILYNYDDRDFFRENLNTWEHNFPETVLITKDIADTYFKIKGHLFNVKPNVIFSSPSCSQLSKLGMKRFDRKDLKILGIYHFDFIKSLKMVLEIKPEFIVMEYLPNLVDFFLIEQTKITHRFSGEFINFPENYISQSIQLNSLNFNVSQSRKRLFIFIWDSKYKFKFQEPMILPHEIKKAKDVFQEIDLLDGLENHEDPKHSQERIEGFAALKPGESYYGTQNNKRIDPNKPCPTIASSKTQHVHPWHPRVLTVRECATIQGFPYDFKFYGSFRGNLDLIGKTVPPPVAKEIAKQIKQSLTEGV